MSRIAILTDSGCQIEVNKHEDEGIFVVPLCITMEDKTYLDQIEINSIEVFEKMEEKDLIVKTSQPNPGEITKALERIKSRGYDEVLGITIATGLSSTLNGFRLAAEMVNIPITLVDSKATAGIQKYLVNTAKELINRGMNALNIKETLDKMVEYSRTIIMAPNLDHLKKGGRITPAVAALGNMLKIVPVMELNHDLGGKIDTLGKVRTIKKAIQTLADRMVELGVNAKDYNLTIEHVLCEDLAINLRDYLFEKIGECEVEVRELPAVVGAHMGVGGVGCQFIKKYNGQEEQFMAFFDDLSKKAAKATETAIDKTKEFAGTAELKLKKKNLETDLDVAYAKLGKYYYELLKDEDSINDDEAAMKEEIELLLDSIDVVSEQIEVAKKEANEQASFILVFL